MQEVLTDKIGGIESKIRQLATKLENMQKAHNTLVDENKKLKSELIKKNTELIDLEKRTKAVPLTAKRTRDSELRNKKMKKEIAQYIKEIDKCIDWLQNS